MEQWKETNCLPKHITINYAEQSHVLDLINGRVISTTGINPTPLNMHENVQLIGLIGLHIMAGNPTPSNMEKLGKFEKKC